MLKVLDAIHRHVSTRTCGLHKNLEIWGFACLCMCVGGLLKGYLQVDGAKCIAAALVSGWACRHMLAMSHWIPDW